MAAKKKVMKKTRKKTTRKKVPRKPSKKKVDSAKKLTEEAKNWAEKDEKTVSEMVENAKGRLSILEKMKENNEFSEAIADLKAYVDMTYMTPDKEVDESLEEVPKIKKARNIHKIAKAKKAPVLTAKGVLNDEFFNSLAGKLDIRYSLDRHIRGVGRRYFF
jgi:uncharacterized protein GlcG (DUF336 family)